MNFENIKFSIILNLMENKQNAFDNIPLLSLFSKPSCPLRPFFNLHKINELMYDHVIHNEANHFTTQNWEAIKPGGWVTQQFQCMQAHSDKSE